MRKLCIGICGPANPSEFKTYLYPNQEVPVMWTAAAAVNAHIQSLLDLNQDVYVFTQSMSQRPGKKVKLINGEKLHFIIFPHSSIPHDGRTRITCVMMLRKIVKRFICHLDILHAQWTYEYAYVASMFSKILPVFCTVRDWCPYQQSIQDTFEGKVLWTINRFLFNRVINDSNMNFIANSDYTYNCLLSYNRNKDVTLIPNGIKSKFILKSRDKYPSLPTFISIAQGLYDPRKNILSLLVAFKKFSLTHKAQLKLIGLYKEDEVEQWRQMGLLGNVLLLGGMNHDEVIKQIDKSSVLVHPSLEETFGNILLEGMARRIPVIGGRKSGGVPNILGNGKYGILCDVTNPDSICGAMEKSIEDSGVNNLVDNATNRLLSTFSSDVVGRKHLELYVSKLNK